MATWSRSWWRAVGIVCVAIGGLCVAATRPAHAQAQLAGIQGTITDQSKALLPGVTVTVTNLETGETRATTSNESGIYRVPGLQPGRYDVSAELAQFRKVVRSDVTVSVGTTLGLNFTLEPGGVTETVTVATRPLDVQTEKADVSAVVERRKVVDLPLVGRNVLSLAALQPGVNGLPDAGTDFLAPEQGLGITASGQRESGNNAMVDGVSINGGPWGGTVLLVPNAEAVQEFQVITNNPSAEYGRNSGAMVSVITKSGTNDLSGSAFTFHRDQALRAKTIFEETKPDFSRNDFGFSVGGPIRRDSTFFFASYERVRETTGEGALYTVETQQFRDFVMQTRPNSIAAKLLDKYRPPVYPTSGLRDLGSPAPGAGVIGPPDGIPDVGTISIATQGQRDGDQLNGRVDQQLRHGQDRLRGTYYLSNIQTDFAYVRPAFNHPFPFRNQLFTAGYSSVLSSRTLNEASFGFVRQHGETGDPTPDAPTIGITGGVAGFGVDFWHPITFTQNNVEFKDTVTMNRGAHSFRAGGELRLGHDFSVLHHWERPNYSFNSILDFADDEPFSELRAVDPLTGASTTAEGNYITNEWGLFVQDNWKVRPNLTMNLGVRYDNFGNPSKSNGPFDAIILGTGATRQQQMIDAHVAAVDTLYNTDWNNFAPRVGIAWDPSSNGALVFHGGVGVSYNRVNNTNYTDERLNPPLFAAATASIPNGVPMLYTLGPAYPNNPALGRGVDAHGGILGARVNLRVIDPNLVTPYAYNWFAGVQRQLPGHFVVEANYIGSAGRHLMTGDGPGGEDYNRIAGDMIDGRQDRLNSSFGQMSLAESSISTSYHGMTLLLNRRYDKGFSFQAAYTLGKATDTAPSAMEVTRPDLDRGPADYDVRHKLALNIIWQIPFSSSSAALKHTLGGWQLNAITILQSGNPFTVVCNLPYPQCDFNADGVNNDRPNTPSFGSDVGSPSQSDYLTGIFTAADFPKPAPGTLGTLGRNSFRGPGYANTDLSFFKNIALGWTGSKNSTVQLRVEIFNVFNRANLGNPVSAMQDGLFGQVTGLRGGSLPRVIQLGAKFLF
jgi:hypothetical protein